MSIIDSCGVDWVNRRVTGGWFCKDGEIMRIKDARRNGIYVDTIDGDEKFLDKEVLSGFKLFMYPRLGYRRLDGNGAVVFLRRINSFDRGVRPNRFSCAPSPANAALGRGTRLRDRQIIKAVFSEHYDTLDVVREVINARAISAVLNADVLVEPSMDNEMSYAIYYREAVAGKIINNKIVWRSKQYEQLLSHLFKGL